MLMTALQVEGQWNRNGPNLADDLLGGRVDGGERLAADGVDIPTDEHDPADLFQRTDRSLQIGQRGECAWRFPPFIESNTHQ